MIIFPLMGDPTRTKAAMLPLEEDHHRRSARATNRARHPPLQKHGRCRPQPGELERIAAGIFD